MGKGAPTSQSVRPSSVSPPSRYWHRKQKEEEEEEEEEEGPRGWERQGRRE